MNNSHSAGSGPDNSAKHSRFVVGIDLGTTNSALCYADTHEENWRIQAFPIPQIAGPGIVESFETLPSFHYEPTADEVRSALLSGPWSVDDEPAGREAAAAMNEAASGKSRVSGSPGIVGVYARDHGRTVAGRMIESAKSWLCHNGVDRRAALLPWQGADGVVRLSPVEVSARYLRHLRLVWNQVHPGNPLESQEIVLTIPASFDEVARELTVAAAQMAGLPRIILLEEPQAAFYSWIHTHRDHWESLVTAGQKILVCDIGGGTTDFSLIQVRSDSENRVRFHRVAVGDHLLLGGDNLDLALAHHVEGKLTAGGRLDSRQWSSLIPACRHAKETLLGKNSPESYSVVVGGGGSRLIGGALKCDVTREELIELLVQGFLPRVDLTERPVRRQSGFQEFGLPYAADSAITRYLAAFLMTHAHSDRNERVAVDDVEAGARPDIVLFNGGFFESPILRSRLIESLEAWFRTEGSNWSPEILRNDRLDLAVAQGAACFGMVRRGTGERIVAGLARTYYIGVEHSHGRREALCLIAAGTESSSESIRLEQSFRVRVAEPVEFPIFVSGTRLNDRPGSLHTVDPEQMKPMPPVRTVLTSRRRSDQGSVEATLSVRLTEIGTLELWCEQAGGGGRWQLQFDVRSAVETDRTAHTGDAERLGIVDQETTDEAVAVLHSIFSRNGDGRPDEVMKRLAEVVGMPRTNWPPSLLRSLWGALLNLHEGRRKSAAHEARWLNLAGYFLRPGFGMAADDWRVEETWRVTNGRVINSTAACLAELRTLCRRISGGFAAGRQNQIASSVLPAIRQRFRQALTGRGKAVTYASGNHEAAEIWRMLGSLELLDLPIRNELGDMAVDLMNRTAFEPIQNALIWALGRIGSRVPVYGPLNLVVPAEKVSQWADMILRTASLQDSAVQLALMQMTRRTMDRFRDIDDGLRERVVERLKSAGAAERQWRLIAEGGSLSAEDTTAVFGESLPAGLELCAK